MGYLLIVMVTLSPCVHSSPFDEFISEAQSPGGTDEDEPWKKPYLPTTIIPTLYDLFLFPNFYFDELVFQGHITIYFRVLNETNTIIVHMRGLHITSTIVIGCQRENVTVNRTFEYRRNNYWVIQTATLLPNASCTARLKLAFNGKVRFIGEGFPMFPPGFYKGTYVNDITGKQSWYVATEFEPSYSRVAFPNFDEPRFKVNLKVTLRHWKNFTALSNMLETEFNDVDSIWRDTVFKKSPKMSSYMACFIISDFVAKSNKLVGGQLHRVWARPDRIDKVDYALNVTLVIENYLHQELELPYRLEKLDQVAIPFLPSGEALENWGIIVYTDSKLLIDITKDGDIARQKALSLIAHELSHNYFGNPVTCRFWNHIWLNEGLATFYEIRAVTAVDPTLFYKEQHFAGRLEETMATDATAYAEPLVPVSVSPGELYDYFNFKRYVKGTAILRMLEDYLGVHNFKHGIRQYLKQNENKTVVTDDLWESLKQAFRHRLHLKDLMRPWIYEKGFPVITLELINSEQQINVTQKRFLIDPLEVSKKTYKWNIPLRCHTSEEDCSIWTTDNQDILNVSMRSDDDWIQINYDMSGYYRVNYDANLWNRLTKQLNRNHLVFSEVSRLKLLSDALNLAKAEQLGYDTLLDLTTYASEEKGYAPWLHIYLSFLDINKMISDTANFSHFQRYFLNLTSPLMDQLQVKDEGRYIEKLLRPKIMSMACSVGHRGCIENTTRSFKAWIQNDTMNAIATYFRPEVYCIGLANSLLESEWNTVYERYTMATSDEHKNELKKALSCSRNVTMLERLLEYSTDETKIGILKGLEVMSDIASNPASENCVWKWLKRNKRSIKTGIMSFFFVTMMESAVQNFKTREQRREVLDFLGDTVSKRNKNGILRIINKNIRWMDRNFATVVSWLEQNAPEQS